MESVQVVLSELSMSYFYLLHEAPSAFTIEASMVNAAIVIFVVFLAMCCCVSKV